MREKGLDPTLSGPDLNLARMPIPHSRALLDVPILLRSVSAGTREFASFAQHWLTTISTREQRPVANAPLIFGIRAHKIYYVSSRTLDFCGTCERTRGSSRLFGFLGMTQSPNPAMIRRDRAARRLQHMQQGICNVMRGD